MTQGKVTVINETGLHARPANVFIRIAAGFPCSVYIEKKGKRYNGKSIVNVLSACVRKDDEITLITDGEREEEAFEELAGAIREGLGE